ncbi:uncharacterized protein LOC130994098 [Salvia miltiorrhiza]|uniref:uncharacterized protein LOC130994098 n=1 Tax=Salvia miltiorrhiza TaxID=226208 RepID=UPI0025ACF041|nr:uncharacterized protein LOC130994098 [Salvia miltiorrhiza]
MYSVKSGYRLAVEIQNRDAASSSNPYGHLWSWIWALDVIPKVKMFMWKCLANALPTAQALRRKNVNVDVLCRRCGVAEESMEHALRDCSWVRVLWAVSPIRIQPLGPEEVCSIPAWFEKIRSLPYREVHGLFASLAWATWFTRNMLLFQQKEFSHIECLTFANRALWQNPSSTQIQNQGATRRFCCGDEEIKINSDTAIKVGMKIGIGSVLTNREGTILGCRFGSKCGAFTVVEGETLAMVEGLKLCRDRGMQDIIAETDCQTLYWLLVRNEADMSYLGDTLIQIHSMKRLFRSLVFSWTPREGNSIADRLANFALLSSSPFVSFGVLPYDVNISFSS